MQLSGSNDAIRRVMQNDVTLRSGVTVLSQGQPAQGPAERPLPPSRLPFCPSRGNPLLSSPRVNLSFSRVRRFVFSFFFSLSLFLSSRDHSTASFALAGLVGLLCCPRTKCIVVKLSHARSTDRRRRDSEERRRKPQPVDRRNRRTDIRGICHSMCLLS